MIELDGVSGSVVPPVPTASIANSVAYETAAQLEAALPEDACSLLVGDVDGNCMVTLVATAPEARGKGLARRLTYAALSGSRDRGTETTTLQASKMGHQIYVDLGYRDLGRMHMYERRKPAS